MEENYNQPPLQPQTPTPKHKLNKANIVMAALLVLALAAAITFGILWGVERNREPEVVEKIVEVEKVVENNTSTTEPETSTTSGKPLMFDTALIVNGDENTAYYPNIHDVVNFTSNGKYPYTLAAYSTGGNTAKVTVIWPAANEIYASNHATSDDYTAPENQETFDVQFSQNIADIFISGFGQMAGNESIFYLMEDGTVERTDIKAAAQSGDFTSHAKLDGLENIVKFGSASAGLEGASAGGYGTSYAQASDGKIYLLFHASQH